jgi:hypothetical protein
MLTEFLFSTKVKANVQIVAIMTIHLVGNFFEEMQLLINVSCHPSLPGLS